jgi:hypothetical protein
MGEMRGSHFHGGIDIKTGGRIGLPVYATSDGYIYRIAIKTGGYGHALYLRHNDGNSSVYAHLNLFEESLEKYVRYKQYENESYTIQLFPEKNLLTYKKGDIIGYSGNTGSSSGPHLHFEIRDENERYLNPLEFGFSEIKDDLTPTIKSIAFNTLEPEARVNGAFGRFEFEVIRVNGKYTTRKPIELSGKIGVDMYHYDNQNGTYNRNGIPEITMLVDSDTVFRQFKEAMAFRLNRNILVHMCYPRYVSRKRRYNRLYLTDGNNLDIYTHPSSGYEFNKSKATTLRILLRDSHDNISNFETTVNTRRIVNPEAPQIKEYAIQDNIIQFRMKDSTATVYYGFDRTKVSPYLRKDDDYYFLWDMRTGLPDSIKSVKSKIITDLYALIPSGYDFSFYNHDFDLTSSQSALFDTVYLSFQKKIDLESNREIFEFKNYQDPLRNSVTITLKPDFAYREGAAVFAKWGDDLNYIGGEMNENGSFTFKTRNFGNFTIDYDTIPPSITPLNWSPSNLKIRITDSRSGIKSFRASINGEFLLMRYEAKRDLLMALPKNPNIPLAGEFELIVEDNSGNLSEIKRKL